MREARHTCLVCRSHGYSARGAYARGYQLPSAFIQRALPKSFSTTNIEHGSPYRENEKDILEGVGVALGISKLEDWYTISKKAISRSERGEVLISRYPSLELLLRTHYPDYNWESDKFLKSRTTKGFFKDSERQRELLEQIGSELGVKELSDWYGITHVDVARRGGWRILRLHKSLQNTLATLYPEVQWDAEKFKEGSGRVKNGYWQDSKNLLHVLDKAERVLNISQPEDWYTVTLADLREIGLPAKIKKPELAELLEKKYPDYKWEKLYLLKGRYAQQKRFEKAIHSLFPNEDIRINARREADLLNPETNEFLELDIYLPSLKLAFEYQEKHHYTRSSLTSMESLDVIQQRDQQKLQLSQSKGITLITVPCWWDGQKDSLVATIKKVRPDLLREVETKGEPIADTAPPGFFQAESNPIEDIGEPVTACFFTLSTVNPTDWWMFEKYDGVRGFWNPLKRRFYSRNGKLLFLPQEVIDSMPSDMFLDGELWFGRNQFRDALKMASSADAANIDWKGFKYMVFDIPNLTTPYEERYSVLVNKLGGKEHPYLDVAGKQICRDISHFEEFFQDIVDKGGEGVILRDPKALLQPGRSAGFLKHKKFRDAEARVLGPVGKHTWECELPNGVRFTAPAGTTEFVKRYNPQKGDIVSFKHHGFLLRSKKPKVPTLYRLRTDITWEDVVNNWKEGKTSLSTTNLRRIRKRAKKAKGYWRDVDHCREYFCEYATKHGFDPLKPENWKTVTKAQLVTEQGFGPIGVYGSMENALTTAFPELLFDAQEMHWIKRAEMNYKKKGYWNDIENRRSFFCALAAEKGFDPFIPENWKDLNNTQLIERKAGILVTRYGSAKEALRKSFPELDFPFKAKKSYKRRSEVIEETERTTNNEIS